MSIKLKFSVFLLLLFPGLQAQTVISGFVKDTTDNPVAGASVYLSRTTIGTLTDAKGAYILTINQVGQFELTASCIGYKSVSVNINSDGRSQNINFVLPVNMFSLNEVTVKSKDPKRVKNYLDFQKLFLGETDNSVRCKINNPEDLHLYRNPENNYLKGFSLKPLRIENKALGYSILYDLVDFNYNDETGYLRFSGNNYFQPMQGSRNKNKNWNRNRLKAFYGSRINLLRAIRADSLRQNDFGLFECIIDTIMNDYSVGKPLSASDITVVKTKKYAGIYHKVPVLVIYTDNHAELESGLTGFQPHKYMSTMVFNDTLKVYDNGFFDNPYSVTWGGTMANERIGEMVPYDFHFEQGTNMSLSDSSFSTVVERYLLDIRNSGCKDQLYLHTDRNMYRSGDTVWFQAYVRDRYTGSFETGSKSLYALLFNDKRVIADSSRFRITNSVAPGWLVIPPDADPGTYHLISFTGAMQDYDPGTAFQTDLYVRKRGTEPVKTALEFDRDFYSPGDTLVATIKLTDLKGNSIPSLKFTCNLLSGKYIVESKKRETGSDGRAVFNFIIPDTISFKPRIEINTKAPGDKDPFTREFICPVDDPFVEIIFLPEGGTMIAGLEQRIAFNATNSRGESIHIEGLLKNAKGAVIDSVRSGVYGPGVFTCVPERGMYVEITDKKGLWKKYSLPEPLDKGLTLSVRSIDKRSFYVEIQADHYSGQKVYVSGIMNSNQVFSEEVHLDRKRRLSVGTLDLPAGVLQVTLFNQDLRPVAERLIYVNPDKRMTFTIKSDKNSYKPDEQTELTITATDENGIPVRGDFSISVYDSVSGLNPEIYSPLIESSLIFHPFLSSSLPSRVLSTGLENIDINDIDLLFMVYGWSRYKWLFNETQQRTEPRIRYETLKMKILYALKSNRADRKLDLVSFEGPSVMHLITDKNGEIDIPLDSLPDITRSVTLMPDARNKKRVQGAMLSIPYNEKYFNSPGLFKIQPVLIPEISLKSPDNYNVSLGDSVIEIPEVTIKGTRQEKIYHDIYEQTYQSGNVRSLDYDQLWTSFTLADAIRRVTFATITEDAVYLRVSTSFFGGAIPALFVLNGMPIRIDGWNNVKMILPSDMTSLTVLRSKDAYIQYGEEALGGVIFINTYSTDPRLMRMKVEWKLQHSKDRMLLPIELYRADKEFYVPDKIEKDTNPVFGNYSTVYWNPDVWLDGENPAKIRFTNLKRTGRVRIVINGVSANDLAGSAYGGYNVK